MSIKKFVSIFVFFLLVNACILCAIDMIPSSAEYSIEFAFPENESTVQASTPLIEPTMPTVESRRGVRLYFPDVDTVATIDMEEYVTGVLTAEMYSDAPTEALKAMSIAARTYTLYMCEKNADKDHDVVADHNYSQAYMNKDNAIEAWSESGGRKYEKMSEVVKSTEGEVLCYENEPICALYHASSYPYTESCENVFVENLPYLQGKLSIESKDDAYRSCVELDLEELNDALDANGFPLLSSVPHVACFKNINGRCEYLLIKDDSVSFTVSGREVRSVFGLRSTSFDVCADGNRIVFDVYGFGHGVGLSQNGAVIMANNGKRYTDILTEYYPGTEIYKTIYKE